MICSKRWAERSGNQDLNIRQYIVPRFWREFRSAFGIVDSIAKLPAVRRIHEVQTQHKNEE